MYKRQVVHCVKGTDGWQINEKVKTALKDAVVIDKPTFGSKILAEEIDVYKRQGRNGHKLYTGVLVFAGTDPFLCS